MVAIIYLFLHDSKTDINATGKGQLTTEEFPFDLDTTSLGFTVLLRDKEVASSVMDEMLEYVDTDGIIQVDVSNAVVEQQN